MSYYERNDMESPSDERLLPPSHQQECQHQYRRRLKMRSAIGFAVFFLLLTIFLLSYTVMWTTGMHGQPAYHFLHCLVLGTAILRSGNTQEYFPCESGIYCYGPLLHAAQFAYIYNDSKSFVDMHMNYDEGKVVADFNSLLNETDNNPSNEQVRGFVDEYFTEPDSEFEHWTPSDWKETPEFLSRIKDPTFRSWANDLNVRWKDLGRKIKDDVKVNTNRYSIIYSPNPVVVPGGRFREFYYWDNYWIIRGLLLSEMYETAKGTIRNFLEMVKTFGFVPNGGRLYYTRRSQPPFLTLMVRDYVNHSGDAEFLEEALPTLEMEHSFWERNRTVNLLDSDGNSYSLSRYASDVNQPRPESYREDYELVHEHNLDRAAQLELMTHVTSACESGWDFSSRWMGPCQSEDSELLLSLRTRDLVPVDLNSILAAVEKTLADFNTNLGYNEKADTYREKYNQRVDAIEKFLWHEEDGTYYDYAISHELQNRQFFLSNVNLLWTKAYPANLNVDEREKKMYDYLKTQSYEGVGVLDFPGGLPTSLNNSGEQWDFPNAWPPIAHMTIEGMMLSDATELKDEAFRQSQKWVNNGWRGYSNPLYGNAMFEKSMYLPWGSSASPDSSEDLIFFNNFQYNVLRDDGLPGSGGEYEVQEGFGWTNGVAMILLDAYGQSLTRNISNFR